MAKLVNKGVLTLMFEPSTSYLNASGCRVDSCMARIGEQGMSALLLVDGGYVHGENWWMVDTCMARVGELANRGD